MEKILGVSIVCLFLAACLCAPGAAGADPVTEGGVWLYCHFIEEDTATGANIYGMLDTKFPKSDTNLADLYTGTPGQAGTMDFPLTPALSGELRLDKSKECIINVYLSPAIPAVAPGGYAPQVHVAATLTAGSKVIGSGEQTQDIGPATPGLTAPPGTKYEIKFLPSVETIPATDNIILSVTLDTAASGFDLGLYGQATGKDNPWGVFMPVLNPLSIESSCIFQNNTVVVTSLLDSPFGTQDINPKSINVSAAGPSETRKANLTKSNVYANGSNKTQLEWVWKYKEDAAKEGIYTVSVTAKTLQGFTVTKESKITITETGGHTGGNESENTEETEKTPGFEAAAIAGSIIFAAVIFRRKR